MDETGAYYTEWSKSERKASIQHINAYVWNLERCTWWPYMYDRKRDTDIKNRLLDSVGEGRVGWFERIALKHVYYHMWNRWPVHVQCMKQGTTAGALGQPEGWDGERCGRGVQDVHMYIHG